MRFSKFSGIWYLVQDNIFNEPVVDVFSLQSIHEPHCCNIYIKLSTSFWLQLNPSNYLMNSILYGESMKKQMADESLNVELFLIHIRRLPGSESLHLTESPGKKPRLEEWCKRFAPWAGSVLSGIVKWKQVNRISK